MRRSTGAIFRETRPETIMTSACLGLARKTSEPNRARSFRDEVAFIISMAQQAKPKVAGHNEDFRAQLINESSRVVSTSGNASAIMFSSPIEIPLRRLASLPVAVFPSQPAVVPRLLRRGGLFRSSRKRLSFEHRYNLPAAARGTASSRHKRASLIPGQRVF